MSDVRAGGGGAAGVRAGSAAGRVAPAGARGPVLAFDFGGTKVEVALAAEGRRIVGRTTLDTDADSGAPQAVERALHAGRELLVAHDVPAPTAVGVSTMGYCREDGVHLAPNVPGWESLRLPSRFRQAFPDIPLALDNDVRAAAHAELKWGALTGVTTGLYVNLGTGVAATLIVDGNLVVGSHGVAGEIGYWLVCPSRMSSEDAAHTIGTTEDEYSTLEVEVGGSGVRDRARSIGVEGGLAELISSANPAATALVRDVLRRIAVSLTNAAILLDPERIVLGGGYTRAGETLVGVIRDSLREHAPVPPEVMIGHFGSDAGLYGAIALAEAAGGAGV